MIDDEKKKVAQSLALMFNAFQTSAVVDVDLQMEAYLWAVEEFEYQDVKSAIERIMKGGEGHEGRAFAPSTAELCKEVRRRQSLRELLAKRQPGLHVVKSKETF